MQVVMETVWYPSRQASRQCGDISNKMYTWVCVGGGGGVREVWEKQLPLCRDVVPHSFPADLASQVRNG